MAFLAYWDGGTRAVGDTCAGRSAGWRRGEDFSVSVCSDRAGGALIGWEGGGCGVTVAEGQSFEDAYVELFARAQRIAGSHPRRLVRGGGRGG